MKPFNWQIHRIAREKSKLQTKPGRITLLDFNSCCKHNSTVWYGQKESYIDQWNPRNRPMYKTIHKCQFNGKMMGFLPNGVETIQPKIKKKKKSPLISCNVLKN